MRITLAQWVLQDWKGPTTNVRFRVTANQSFTARDDDNSGVEVDAGTYREVDCVVGSAIIEGVTVPTITIPSFWLFSTNDALLPIRTASYRAAFVAKNGRELQQLQLLQHFQLFKELEAVFNPVPWHEILRANYPAAPMPMDKETYSVSQILDLIGGGTILKGGNATAPRVAFWSGPITVDGAIGFEYQNADPMVKLVQQNATWNPFRVVENSGAANVKVNSSPSLFTTHAVDEAGLWQRAIINDAATRRWTEVVKDGANGLMYSAYDSSNVLIGRAVFDPTGGVAISDSAADFGYFYKASSAYHLGIAASLGIGGASKEITFTTSGVGVNKPTSIGAQLHLVSGAAGRIGFLVDTASSPSQPIAALRNNGNNRFVFNHDAVATFGLASSVKGKLAFAVANNSNTQTLEAADTPASSITYKLPATDPGAGQLLRTLSFGGGVAVLEWVNPTSGGDVSSDIGSVTDNTLARFNGTSGKLITSSAITVADTSGAFAVPNGWSNTSAAGCSETFNTPATSVGSIAFVAPASATDGFGLNLVHGSQTQASSIVKTFRVATTYNQTGTANSDSISIERTETALGSGQHNFIRGFSGVGGNVVAFRINNVGNYFFGFTNSHIGDANGNELLRFDHVASAVNEMRITNAATGGNPKLEATGGDTNVILELSGKGTSGAASHVRIKNFAFINGVDNSGLAVLYMNDSVNVKQVSLALNNNSWNLNRESGGFANVFNVDLPTLVTTFAAIPVLPGSDPTTGNQATRKTYVDTRRIRWAVTFIYPNISILGTAANFDDIPGALIPGSNFTYTHGFCKVASGTMSGGVIVTLRKQPFANQTQTDITAFNINPSGGDVTTLGVGVEHSLTPTALTANDFIYPVVTATAASAAKMVWIGLRGYQTTENP